MPSVLKKDKTNEEFEINKVIASMEKPFKAAGIDDPEFILRSAMFIQDKVYAKGNASICLIFLTLVIRRS